MSSTKIHYINLDGEIWKEIDLMHKGKKLNLVNAVVIGQRKWLFVEEKAVYFVRVREAFAVEQCLEWPIKISGVFKGTSGGNGDANSRFVVVVAEDHTINLVAKGKGRWQVQYTFTVPNLNIKQICLYIPAVNTHTVNKFKDRLFVIVHGQPLHSYYDRNRDIGQFSKYLTHEDTPLSPCLPIPKELLKDTHLYAYEYKVSQLTAEMKGEGSLLQNSFCLKGNGTAK